jgi:hypothetical protein
MFMFSKFPVSLSVLIILLAACGPSPSQVSTATIAPRENVSTVAPIQPTVLATETAAVPKHKDLTFVEFFAVT